MLPFRLALGLCLFFTFTSTHLAYATTHALDTWVDRTPVGNIAPLTEVAYGAGVFVAASSSGQILTSSDGATWQVSGPTTNVLLSLKYLNGEFIGGGERFIIRSPDGTNWTTTRYPGNFGASGIAYGNGLYSICYIIAFDAVSTNAVDWITRSGFSGGGGSGPFGGHDVVFWRDRFIKSDRGPSYSSTNGRDWTLCLRGDDGIYSFTAGGPWVATVGNNTTPLVYHSPDGIQWQTNRIGSAGLYGAIGFGAGYYLAGGINAYAYTTNMTSWQTNALPVPMSVRGVAYGRGTFVMVGSGWSGSYWNGYALTNGIIVQSEAIAAAAPVIVLQPRPANVYAGGSLALNVGIFGTAQVTYQWRKNGTNINGATSSTLTIPVVHVLDDGLYDVVVANSLGSTTSTAVRVNVNFLEAGLFAGAILRGHIGSRYAIEYITEAGATNWQPITNIQLQTSPQVWIDLDTPRNLRRFYRAALIP